MFAVCRFPREETGFHVHEKRERKLIFVIVVGHIRDNTHQCITFSVMFHFGELLEVSSTEFQIIESPLSVSIVNMSDLRLEGKELSVSSPFGVYAKVEKKRR